MNHVKLFENYTQTENQRATFGRGEISVTFPKTIINPDAVNQKGSQDLVNLGLVDSTIPVEDYWIESVTIEYDIQPVYSRFGIEDISLNLKKVYINGTYDILKGDDIDTFDFNIIDEGPFLGGRVEISTHGLPLYPNEIEIDLSELDEFYPDQKSNIPKYAVTIGT